MQPQWWRLAGRGDGFDLNMKPPKQNAQTELVRSFCTNVDKSWLPCFIPKEIRIIILEYALPSTDLYFPDAITLILEFSWHGPGNKECYLKTCNSRLHIYDDMPQTLNSVHHGIFDGKRWYACMKHEAIDVGNRAFCLSQSCRKWYSKEDPNLIPGQWFSTVIGADYRYLHCHVCTASLMKEWDWRLTEENMSERIHIENVEPIIEAEVFLDMVDDSAWLRWKHTLGPWSFFHKTKRLQSQSEHIPPSSKTPTRRET